MVVHAKSFDGNLANAVWAFALVLIAGVASSAIAQTVQTVPGAGPAVVAPADDAQRFSSEGLTEFAVPGGGVAVDLEGRFKHYLVAHTGPDGKLHVGCTQDPGSEHTHAPADEEVSE